MPMAAAMTSGLWFDAAHKQNRSVSIFGCPIIGNGFMLLDYVCMGPAQTSACLSQLSSQASGTVERSALMEVQSREPVDGC